MKIKGFFYTVLAQKLQKYNIYFNTTVTVAIFVAVKLITLEKVKKYHKVIGQKKLLFPS